MFISEISLNDDSDSVRADAKVVWESADRAPNHVYVAIERRFAQGFRADANGFLIAALLAGWHAGESRLKIEGEICPLLCENINAALATLRLWYPEMGKPPAVEASSFKVNQPVPSGAVSFLSCGIDSLATLRANKLQLPPEHPSAIDSVLMIGFDGASFMTEQERTNTKRQAASAEVAADAKVTAIAVETNLLCLDTDGWFFTYKWHGAVLSALAHFFSGRFRKAFIASTYDAANLEPWGSHPLLDNYYSSAHLQIEHHGLHLTRLEKTRLIADWPAGLQNILVCQGKEGGTTNCGGCEKCIRTMTALVAFGKLQDSRSFPRKDVTPELLRTVRDYEMIYNQSQVGYYQELVPALQASARHDLVKEIDELLAWWKEKQSVEGARAQQAAALIPGGENFIVVDREQFGCALPNCARGRYWGPPTDSQVAIRELESLRRHGFRYLVFHRPSLWWLDYYADFGRYLNDSFMRTKETPDFVVFDLSAKTAESNLAQQLWETQIESFA
jgi:hypothetical protein